MGTRRTRLYNNSTGRWEWWTVEETPLRPWRFVRLETLLALRGLASVLRGMKKPHPQVLELDPDTLNMLDPKRERRQRRRDRRDRMLAKAANALNSMVEMQKHIK